MKKAPTTGDALGLACIGDHGVPCGGVPTDVGLGYLLSASVDSLTSSTFVALSTTCFTVRCEARVMKTTVAIAMAIATVTYRMCMKSVHATAAPTTRTSVVSPVVIAVKILMRIRLAWRPLAQAIAMMSSATRTIAPTYATGPLSHWRNSFRSARSTRITYPSRCLLFLRLLCCLRSQSHDLCREQGAFWGGSMTQGRMFVLPWVAEELSAL